MKLRRRQLIAGALASGLGATGTVQPSSSPAVDFLLNRQHEPMETIDLWPGGAPGMPAQALTEHRVDRSTNPEQPDRFVNGISRPRMAVIKPDLPNGAAILITPGGGYQRVVMDKEGIEPGHWFATRGFTVFVLLYRLPGEGWAAGPNVALSDAQRAIRVIRDRAGNYGVDPERLAAMGFSAGGHVCADLATRFAARTYDPVDSADILSARPMLAAPIYPVISMMLPAAHASSRQLLIGKDADGTLEQAHSPHRNVPSDAPPCFLLHAEDDDSVAVENTLKFRAALQAESIPVETHLFANGGHGFGLRGAVGKPIGLWPELFTNWSRSMGLF